MRNSIWTEVIECDEHTDALDEPRRRKINKINTPKKGGASKELYEYGQQELKKKLYLLGGKKTLRT